MAGSSKDSNREQLLTPMPQIWLCHQTPGEDPVIPGWLTDYERKTVAKFGGPRKREYLTSRWLIRQAISRSSGEPLTGCRPVPGRPNRSEQPPGFYLSLSHSHGLSACVASPEPGLGIDIEPLQRHPQWHKVVKRWFTPREQDWLFRADDPRNFLVTWTLKEAWLKATGRGIANNLQTLEVLEGFELQGDQSKGYWSANCYECEGFLVTLVWQQSEATDLPVWPAIQLLQPPAEDFSLSEAKGLDTSWEPRIRRNIHPPVETR
ncbi:4'-phosphopantetheinyl transferase superfamily protein [Marinobacter pelagius]|uniref:4'-phosphopantetheinyl transferase family protein n=1 Tax=Marinobacter sp. C7 TaxID=2951363 RepID=UPI001EF133E4|nr:4'-phosphopantetheinyl transferase superfamily protein [Marinobacter sp. C7]MCG7200446.1 4'-phosphopantetheinyl transferase superfamily protein [Marinobacter sp. C7]